jgi:enhancing lycopene biosynthesis protein 2
MQQRKSVRRFFMKIGIVLSGCGVQDGTEIHEAVLTMLHLDRSGAQIVCAAPDADQTQVVNHVSGQVCGADERNMLFESARIARGEIIALDQLNASDIDALILPGGLGAARNLCTFADDGAQCSVRPDVEQLILDMLQAGKPLGALCIAPVVLARVLGARDMPVELTIGNDPGVAGAIADMGARHVDCPVDRAVTDTQYRVVTSPAYMLASGIHEVYKSTGALVDAIMKLCEV